MHHQIHRNAVFCRDNPEPGHHFRQIVIIEGDMFQVRILEGEVIQTDPGWFADNQDAELYMHPTLESAMADLDREVERTQAEGWKLYLSVSRHGA